MLLGEVDWCFGVSLWTSYVVVAAVVAAVAAVVVSFGEFVFSPYISTRKKSHMIYKCCPVHGQNGFS